MMPVRLLPTFFFFVLLLCSYWSCQSSQVAVEVPHTRPLTVDGQLNDWSANLMKAPNQEAFTYAIANDADNIYLALRLSDRGLQRQLMNLGMTIYVDTTAKRREKIGIGYPLALTEKEMEKIAFAATKGTQSVDERALLEAYAETCQDFELIGFVEENPKERIRVSNLASRGIKTAIGQDQLGAMLIEYKIPLRQLYNQPPSQPVAWDLCVQINNPDADAGEDPGLFDDPGSNPITRSAQTNNPLMQGNNPMGMGQAQAQPSRRGPLYALKVWTRLQIDPKAS